MKVKGGRYIEYDLENLLFFKDKIDTNRMKAPSFLMVLTGTEFSNLRNDGVYVVPLGGCKIEIKGELK